MTRRLWAEVDLRAIRSNVRTVARYVHPAAVMAIVKANAYGHGMLDVSAACVAAGAQWLGVATASEGLSLRAAFPQVPIALTAPFLAEEAHAIVAGRLTPFVSDLAQAQSLSDAAARLGAVAAIHLEVDTSLARSGVDPEEAAEVAQSIAALPGIRLEGLCTHFACADEDLASTRRELACFAAIRRKLADAGMRISVAHCAASAALVGLPSSRMDLVRPGLLIYGIRPAIATQVQIPPVTPALSLKSTVALIRTVPAGRGVSYGHTHTLRRTSRLATIPVGYGDGYPRALSNRGCVLIAGRRAPILGRVCMDVTVVDVTDIPEAQVGAEVVLIGKQRSECITVEEVARMAGTTVHDITTRLTDRVDRVYLDAGAGSNDEPERL
ncbi:MAG: alanine racemase [Chthonomonadales bacterium]